MKKWILTVALVALAPMAARAQTRVFIAASSSTYKGIAVTTGTAVQLDASPMTSRTHVVVQVPTGGSTVWVGFDGSVSTTSVSASQLLHLGREVTAGVAGEIELFVDPGVKIWAMAADAAGAGGQPVNVTQDRPREP